MSKRGNVKVWLTGSRTEINRVLYENEDGRYYVYWGGRPIEVRCGDHSWYTVELY